jgi:SAM-dependent methyltransferase
VARLHPEELEELTQRTLSHYEGHAASFWEGTREHDVSQNIDALLAALADAGVSDSNVPVSAPGESRRYRILDFGCGPGRDLVALQHRGHEAVGLDGCASFVSMARELSGATVYHQQFLALDLPAAHFDGVFANASLFHVPTQELPRVLGQLWGCLVPEGVLLSSNPRGDNREGYSGARYGAYHDEERWQRLCRAAGFELITHYYRPDGLPRDKQPWLVTVWRKLARPG